jgi:hypothetical protein
MIYFLSDYGGCSGQKMRADSVVYGVFYRNFPVRDRVVRRRLETHSMLKTKKTYHSHRNQNTRRWFGRPWVNNDFYLEGVKKRMGGGGNSL